MKFKKKKIVYVIYKCIIIHFKFKIFTNSIQYAMSQVLPASICSILFIFFFKKLLYKRGLFLQLLYYIQYFDEKIIIDCTSYRSIFFHT